MIILRSIDDLAGLKGPIVLAAGTFDGVHLGHQALIRRAMEEASACGGTAVVMTFDRHPASLLRPEKAPKLLTRNNGKTALLEGMGVPALLLLEFTSDLAGVPARDFIASLVTACSPLHAFCVGRQWTFGKGGEGNVALLKELGAERKFEVIQIDPVMAADSPISSTRIRKAIASGDFAESSACLGRPFLLTGKVVSGAGLGVTIGFPTANLSVEGMQLPPDGVYAVRVHREGRVYRGVANIGVRPTVDPTSSKRTVEVHLFDWSEDLGGKELSLELVKFLRGEEKFSGLDALKGQIAKDCERARAILSS
jgi:riboflavin kinase/FMN adenylyltransferase